jgi:hypothetical protein
LKSAAAVCSGARTRKRMREKGVKMRAALVNLFMGDSPAGLV